MADSLSATNLRNALTSSFARNVEALPSVSQARDDRKSPTAFGSFLIASGGVEDASGSHFAMLPHYSEDSR